jgi:hypothetical protein
MLSRATRLALALELHRKVVDPGVSEEVMEERRRLFWGLYVMKRRYTISMRGVLGFADEVIDIEVSLP